MKFLLEAYKRMLFIRLAQQELVKHYLDKKVFSMVHFYVGQEAVAVGVCDALGKEDMVLGNHRSHGHYLAKGGSFRTMAAELFGRATGSAHGKGGSMHQIGRSVGFMGSTPLLGSVAPIAAGVAFAQKYNKKKGIVAAFYGDGASEEGGVYETYNLAALYAVPLLLVIENNGWSINSHSKNRRAPGYDIQKIATGLGMRYERANGNDYKDVVTKAHALVKSIRAEKGPAVLECMVYRHMAHSTPLMEEKFRQEDTLLRRQKEDPIKKLRKALQASGVLAMTCDAEEQKLRSRIRADIAWALKQPFPAKKELYTNVYA
ncbi:MAG: thiamine pyrophosphate-dependent dehydrogenase E1 component subunit alpha [Patescibacteria group bacterium]